MNETQYQELVAKLGKEVADKLKAEAEALERKMNEMFAAREKGLVKAEDINEVKTSITAAKTEAAEAAKKVGELESVLQAQGTKIKELELAGAGADEEDSSLEAIWEKNIEQIKEIRGNGSGHMRFYFGELSEKAEKKEKGKFVKGIKTISRKAAGITSIGNSTASVPTQVTNPYTPFPTQLPDVVAVRRNPNFALNYVDLGRTDSAVMTWSEEGNSEGYAAIVAEGGLKPLQDKKFVDRISKAKKIAGHVIVTEEMEDDAPRLATAVRRLFQENVMRKYDDQVWADLVAISPGYTSTNLDDAVDNADDFAAIGAAICQLENLNAAANTVCINPADKWKMKLTKGTDGHYVTPPFVSGDKSFDGIRVVTSNKVAPGYFLVAEMDKYKVDEYKPFSLRVGWQNDDFVKNQFTIVGEVRFHSYVATNDLVAFCYASFATVKTAIEKP